MCPQIFNTTTLSKHQWSGWLSRGLLHIISFEFISSDTRNGKKSLILTLYGLGGLKNIYTLYSFFSLGTKQKCMYLFALAYTIVVLFVR